jgi:endogenous inhibitor of DNA gyrase (YacG/DUF329 family)
MTLQQKEQIVDMRHNNVGYSKIAAALDISENTIKTYCRRNNLTGTAVPNAESTGPVITAAVNEFSRVYCEQCGALIIQLPGRKRKRFCSDKCRLRWWNAHPEVIDRKSVRQIECEHCGAEFADYDSRNRKYCSHTCYIADKFSRKGNAYAV